MHSEPGIIYQDNHLLVLAKPACMPCVPDSSHDLSLLDWGRHYLKVSRSKKGNVFLGVVHRLDRPVSGAVCLAVTSKAASRLSDQMRRREIRKHYLAVTRHRPPGQAGTVETYLLKDRRNNRVRTVPEDTPGARAAITAWRYLQEADGLYLLALEPGTGRPHQLRVHCAELGCVLAGDLKYGDRTPLQDASIALHARSLEITHPVKREKMIFHAPLPGTPPWKAFHAGIVAGEALTAGIT